MQNSGAKKNCKKSNRTLPWQASIFGCCIYNMTLALHYQKEYNALSHTKCTLPSNLNQHTVEWRPSDINGIFYKNYKDLQYALKLRSYLNNSLPVCHTSQFQYSDNQNLTLY